MVKIDLLTNTLSSCLFISLMHSFHIFEAFGHNWDAILFDETIFQIVVRGGLLGFV